MKTLTFTLRLFATIFTTMAMAGTQAQGIHVVDKDGRGIPYATVLNTDGNLIGTTSLIGTLGDVGGAGEVLVTHMAYKPQQVVVSSLKDGNITMEEIDFSLPDLEETTNPDFYIETYYRAYAFVEGSLQYYTAGIMPLDYNWEKMIKAGDYKSCKGEFYTNFTETDKKNFLKLFNTHFSPYNLILPMLLEENEVQESLSMNVKDVSQGQKGISIQQETVGKITQSGKKMRLSFDMTKLLNKAFNLVGLRERTLSVIGNKKAFVLYTAISENDIKGTTIIDDLRMFSNHFSWTDRKEHECLIVETYIIERSYINPQEFKAKQKQLKSKFPKAMSLDDLETYAAEHHIPALAPALRNAIERLN